MTHHIESKFQFFDGNEKMKKKMVIAGRTNTIDWRIAHLIDHRHKISYMRAQHHVTNKVSNGTEEIIDELQRM